MNVIFIPGLSHTKCKLQGTYNKTDRQTDQQWIREEASLLKKSGVRPLFSNYSTCHTLTNTLVFLGALASLTKF